MGNACSFSMLAETTFGKRYFTVLLKLDPGSRSANIDSSLSLYLAVGADATVSGNIGLNAIQSSFSGLQGLTMDKSGQFATSSSVMDGGRVMSQDMAQPTGHNLTQASK